jgi:phosphopantothenoylcysteine synthetase/decarboxylase
LKPSPKIISILRERAPNSIIVGFKLGEDEKNVIKEAKNLLKENKLNFVVANVISGIDSDKNKVWLLDENEKKTMIKGYKLKITNDIFDIIKNK